MSLDVDLTEYKMGQGEYFDDRVDDLSVLLEQYFDGHVVDTVEDSLGGQTVTCYVVEHLGVDGLDRVVAGRVRYGSKKDALAVDFIETHPTELDPNADPREAIESKNEFLHEVTGRTAEDRKESWKNDVEDA